MQGFSDSKKMSIRLSNVDIGYIENGKKSVVSKSLSAYFQGGMLTCLLGNNGIGKSTLLRTIARLQPTLGGNVLLCSNQGETNVATLSRHQLSRTVGVVLTDRAYAINLTAYELVAMGRVPHTGFLGRLNANDKVAIDRALQTVGVADYAKKTVRSLSDGMLQRTMIAKALAQQTALILLDEPTAFLDFSSKVSIMRLLLHLAHDEGKTILMTTHDVQLSLKMSDSIAVMDNDSIDVATPQEMTAHRSLQQLIAAAGASINKDTLTIDF